MMHLFAAMLTISTAHAADLGAGVFGVPWGETAAMPAPFPTGCAEHHEGLVSGWVCRHELAGVPLTSTWARRQGRTYGLQSVTQGADACTLIAATLIAGWGQPLGAPKQLEDHAWIAQGAAAKLTFNRFTSTCTLLAIHLPTMHALDALDAAAGAKAADSL